MTDVPYHGASRTHQEVMTQRQGHGTAQVQPWCQTVLQTGGDREAGELRQTCVPEDAAMALQQHLNLSHDFRMDPLCKGREETKALFPTLSINNKIQNKSVSPSLRGTGTF